jgi:hypothetical protein
MLFLPELRGRLDDSDYVAFGLDGSPLKVAIAPDFGLATVLVSTATDAMKRVSADGLIVESVDREAAYRIEGFVLNRVILHEIGDASLSAEQLYETVVRLGHVWNVAPMP